METIGPFYGYVVRGFAIPNTPPPSLLDQFIHNIYIKGLACDQQISFSQIETTFVMQKQR